jgi:uncharacterized RDD family membrane protein YckC
MAATRVARQSSLSRPRSEARLRYASFEARVVAGILDAVVLFLITAMLTAFASLIVLISSDFERVAPSDTAITLFWVCIVSIAPAALLYLFVSLVWKGQTIGKSVMHIMIIRNDGRPLGVLGSLGRIIGLLVYPVFLGAGALGAYVFRDSSTYASIAMGIAVFLVISGILWAAFDSNRRTLHDRIAGTIVVRVG